jgi:hypothetical protein
MQREAHRFLHTIAIVLALAALFPVAAAAGRWGPGVPSRAGQQLASVHMTPGTCHQYCDTLPSSAGRPRPAPTVLRPRVVTVAARGFSWDDAAIGFGTACGLTLVAFGALAYRRNGAVHEVRESV